MPNASKHAVLFDLDGTLVDSTYQHVRIWSDVLAKRGWPVPQWKIQRAIGLPSDRLLRWLLGRRPEGAETLIADHDDGFAQAAPTLRPTEGALELLRDLEERAVPFRAVTSANQSTRELLFKALGRDIPVSSGKGGKPNPEPLETAIEELGVTPERVTMIGDAIWDGESARRSGAHFIGLRCGGTSDELLLQAGALWIDDAPRDLVGRL